MKYMIALFLSLSFISCGFNYNSADIKYVNETDFLLQISSPDYARVDANKSFIKEFNWVESDNSHIIKVTGTLFTNRIESLPTPHTVWENYYTNEELLLYNGDVYIVTVKYNPLLLDYVFVYTKE